jgi:lipopolysaccharide biosynthesis protein
MRPRLLSACCCGIRLTAQAPFDWLLGAIDGYCSNGMIFGSYDLFGKRHTKGFSQADLEEFVGNSFLMFQRKIQELRQETFKTVS